jgi:spore coat polysaccharide biosynthesis protein SpsF (cytidylyltransferase family)
MKIGAIIQARMSSTRFAGKVLHDVNGKCLLQYVIDRLQRSKFVDTLVVATSTDSRDDDIYNFCRQGDINIHRGPLTDVAGRFLGVVETYEFDAFVRVCADSPLIDQTLIDKAGTVFLEGDFDLVTNTLCRTYPKGQSVEVIRSSVFRQACSEMETADDKEHVTRYFYRNSDRFKIHNFQAPKDYSLMQLSVDTSEDMEMFKTLVLQMDRPHWEYDVAALVQLYQLARQNIDAVVS